MPRIAPLYERVRKLEQHAGGVAAAQGVQAVELSVLIGQIAGLSAQIVSLSAQLAAVQADIALVHLTFNSHVSNNARHTGTLIGGLL